MSLLLFIKEFDSIGVCFCQFLEGVGLTLIEFGLMESLLAEDNKKFMFHLFLNLYNIFFHGMNRSNQRNYEVKKQTKIDNRQNKYTKKSALRHEDDANRLNVERKKMIERQQRGIEYGHPERKKQGPWEQVKVFTIILLCIATILFFGFRLLQKKAESQEQS